MGISHAAVHPRSIVRIREEELSFSFFLFPLQLNWRQLPLLSSSLNCSVVSFSFQGENKGAAFIHPLFFLISFSVFFHFSFIRSLPHGLRTPSPYFVFSLSLS